MEAGEDRQPTDRSKVSCRWITEAARLRILPLTFTPGRQSLAVLKAAGPSKASQSLKVVSTARCGGCKLFLLVRNTGRVSSA